MASRGVKKVNQIIHRAGRKARQGARVARRIKGAVDDLACEDMFADAAGVAGSCEWCGKVKERVGSAVDGSAEDDDSNIMGDAEEDIADEIISDYEMKNQAEYKVALLRAVAKALNETFDLGINADEKDIESLSKSIVSKVDLAKKQKITNDPEKQKQIVKAFADVLNRYYPELIDVSGATDVNYLLTQVSDIIFSISASCFKDYIVAAGGIRRTINNLRVISNALELGIKNTSKSSDSEVVRNMKYAEQLKKLLDQQVANLSGFINATSSTVEKQLARRFEDEAERVDYIHKLDLRTGTTDFGEAIREIFRGIGGIYYITPRVAKYLKDSGLTVAKLREFKNWGEVENLVFKQGISGLPEDATQLLLDLQAIYMSPTNVSGAAERRRRRRRTRGSADEQMDQMNEQPQPTEQIQQENVEGSKYGSAEETRIERLARTDAERRDTIFKLFGRQIVSAYEKIANEFATVVDKVRRGEIKPTSYLEEFSNAMINLSQSAMLSYNLTKIIIGYYKDRSATQEREKFLMSLRAVLKGVEASEDMQKHFEGVARAISELIHLLEKNSDEIAQVYGSADEIEGSGLDDDNYIAKSANKLKLLISQFIMLYALNKQIAMIKVQADVKTTSEDYKKTLGLAIAGKINEIKKNYETFVTNIDAFLASPAAANANVVNNVPSITVATYQGAGGADTQTVPIKTYYDGVKAIIRERVDERIRFYKFLEAFDIFLDTFSLKAAKNIDVFEKLSKLIEEYEIINDIYGERTGDDLVMAFEAGNLQTATSIFNGKNLDTIRNNLKGKYYNYLSEGSITEVNGAHNAPLENGGGYLSQAANSRNTYGILSNNATPNNVQIPAHGFNSRYTLLTKQQDYKDFLNVRFDRFYNNFALIKNFFSAIFNIAENILTKDEMPQTPTAMFTSFSNILRHASFRICSYDNQIGDAEMRASVPEAFAILSNNSFATTGQFLQMGADAAANSPYIRPELVAAGAAGTYELGTNMMNAANGLHRLLAITPSIPCATLGQEFYNFGTEYPLIYDFIKSAVTKIMVAVGLSKIYRQPTRTNEIYQFRSIIGSADAGLPTVMPEAGKLYFYSMILIRFYQQVYKKVMTTGPVTVSILPEFGTYTFKNLFELAFLKANYTSDGNFSTEDCKTIINEVNRIYEKAKSKNPQDPTMDAVNDLIKDANSIFGALSANEMTKIDEYRKTRSNRMGAPGLDSDYETRQFNILPGEDDISRNKILPSDMYTTGFEGDADSSLAKPVINYDIQKKLIGDFIKIVNEIIGITGGGSGTDPATFTEYNSTLNKVIKDIRESESPEKKFELAISLVRGNLAGPSMKGIISIMYHDLVLGGFDILNDKTNYVSSLIEEFNSLDLDYQFSLSNKDAGYADVVNMTADDLKKVYNRDKIGDRPMPYSDDMENVNGKKALLRISGDKITIWCRQDATDPLTYPDHDVYLTKVNGEEITKATLNTEVNLAAIATTPADIIAASQLKLDVLPVAMVDILYTQLNTLIAAANGDATFVAYLVQIIKNYYLKIFGTATTLQDLQLEASVRALSAQILASYTTDVSIDIGIAAGGVNALILAATKAGNILGTIDAHFLAIAAGILKFPNNPEKVYQYVIDFQSKQNPAIVIADTAELCNAVCILSVMTHLFNSYRMITKYNLQTKVNLMRKGSTHDAKKIKVRDLIVSTFCNTRLMFKEFISFLNRYSIKNSIEIKVTPSQQVLFNYNQFRESYSRVLTEIQDYMNVLSFAVDSKISQMYTKKFSDYKSTFDDLFGSNNTSSKSLSNISGRMNKYFRDYILCDRSYQIDINSYERSYCIDIWDSSKAILAPTAPTTYVNRNGFGLCGFSFIDDVGDVADNINIITGNRANFQIALIKNLSNLFDPRDVLYEFSRSVTYKQVNDVPITRDGKQIYDPSSAIVGDDYQNDLDKFRNSQYALYRFNELLNKFVRSLYDESSEKILQPLLGTFANAFNSFINFNGRQYPDTVPDLSVFENEIKKSVSKSNLSNIISTYNLTNLKYLRDNKLMSDDDIVSLLQSGNYFNSSFYDTAASEFTLPANPDYLRMLHTADALDHVFVSPVKDDYKNTISDNVKYFVDDLFKARAKVLKQYDDFNTLLTQEYKLLRVGDPVPDSIISSSNAGLLRKFFNLKSKDNTLSHLYATYSEMPDFMKETTKGLLPYYLTLWSNFKESLENIKNVVSAIPDNQVRNISVPTDKFTDVVDFSQKLVGKRGYNMHRCTANPYYYNQVENLYGNDADIESYALISTVRQYAHTHQFDNNNVAILNKFNNAIKAFDAGDAADDNNYVSVRTFSDLPNYSNGTVYNGTNNKIYFDNFNLDRFTSFPAAVGGVYDIAAGNNGPRAELMNNISKEFNRLNFVYCNLKSRFKQLKKSCHGYQLTKKVGIATKYLGNLISGMIKNSTTFQSYVNSSGSGSEQLLLKILTDCFTPSNLALITDNRVGLFYTTGATNARVVTAVNFNAALDDAGTTTRYGKLVENQKILQTLGGISRLITAAYVEGLIKFEDVNYSDAVNRGDNMYDMIYLTLLKIVSEIFTTDADIRLRNTVLGALITKINLQTAISKGIEDNNKSSIQINLIATRALGGNDMANNQLQRNNLNNGGNQYAIFDIPDIMDKIQKKLAEYQIPAKVLAHIIECNKYLSMNNDTQVSATNPYNLINIMSIVSNLNADSTDEINFIFAAQDVVRAAATVAILDKKCNNSVLNINYLAMADMGSATAKPNVVSTITDLCRTYDNTFSTTDITGQTISAVFSRFNAVRLRTQVCNLATLASRARNIEKYNFTFNATTKAQFDAQLIAILSSPELVERTAQEIVTSPLNLLLNAMNVDSVADISYDAAMADVNKSLTFYQQANLKGSSLALLDNLVRGTEIILKSTNDVLASINDQPKFCEFSQNFSADYFSLNKKKPFMPLSMANFYSLKETPNPAYKFGTTEFKLLYGLRGFLNSSGQLKNAAVPGVLDELVMYNGGVKKTYMISENDMMEVANEYANSLRNSYNFRVNRILTVGRPLQQIQMPQVGQIALGETVPDESKMYPSFSNCCEQPLEANNKYEVSRYSPERSVVSFSRDNMLTYQALLATSINEVVSLSENTTQDDEYTKLIKCVDALFRPTGTSQDALLRNVILDLAIMPIDVSVIKKDIPLANIYIYSNNFDNILQNYLLYTMKNNLFPTTDTVNLLTNFLNQTLVTPNPGEVNRLMNRNLVANPQGVAGPLAFTGQGQLAIANPETALIVLSSLLGSNSLITNDKIRFVTDQLFNKVLIKSNIAAAGYQASWNAYYQNPQSTDGSLNYLKDDGSLDKIPPRFFNILASQGDARMNSFLVKTIMYISLVYSMLQERISQELNEPTSVLARGNFAADPSVLEMRGREPVGYRNNVSMF